MDLEKLREKVVREADKVKKFSSNTKKSIGRMLSPKDVELRMERLREYMKNYDSAYGALEEVDADVDPDEQENIVECFYAAQSELNNIHAKLQEEKTPRVVLNNDAALEINRAIQLKPIEPPVFSGELEDWISFRDMFESLITKNVSLSDIHQLQYLRTACKGKAADLIQDIAIAEGNFTVAWEALKERYENKRLLVARLIDRIMDLPEMTRECPDQLAKLINGTNQNLRALEVLDRPVNEWDDWIVRQMIRKLDFNTRMSWEKEISTNTDIPTYEQLKTHLGGVLRSLEAMKAITNTAQTNGSKRAVRTHIVLTNHQCPLCQEGHWLTECGRYRDMSINKRREFVVAQGLCFSCVKAKHLGRFCLQKMFCDICNKRHHTTLHTNDGQPETEIDTPRRINPFNEKAPETISTNICTFNQMSDPRATLLPTAWVRATGENGKTVCLRALIDQGSEASLISQGAVQQLGITWRSTDIKVTGVAGSSAGKANGCVTITIGGSKLKGEEIKTRMLIIKNITSPLPSQLIKRSMNETLRNLQLADEEYWKPKRIDLLLGAASFPMLLKPGVCKEDGLIAQDTIFGWILSGIATSQADVIRDPSCNHLTLEVLLSRFWEQEEIQTHPQMSNEEEECELIYSKTTARNDDGRYIVDFPFRQIKELGESRAAAIRRLMALERKGARHPIQFATYKEFMKSYQLLGHMERVPDAEVVDHPQCYLPHHAVFKPDSTTTKLRVVFDASALTTNGRSLNDTLLVGPRLQDKLTTILIRWRKHRIAITADIEKMYRQILVNPKQCDYQRIVWRQNEQDEIEDFRLKTVTYGTASAPYLAVKTLYRLADDEERRFPIAAKVVRSDFYVDDCMSGADNVDEAIDLKIELLGIMKAGGLKLLKWSSNSKELLQTLPEDHIECKSSLQIDEDDSIKALGVYWHPGTDEFAYKVNAWEIDTESTTKRQILSEISKLFDPLGLLAPVVITAKILMQQLWLTGCSWDEDVPKKDLEKWRNIKTELKEVEKVRVKRWFGLKKGTSIQFHGFSDASKVAFSACLYARVVDEDGTVQVTLLAAKTKVAPIKQQSIPRLELNGAVLLSRLINECYQAVNEIKVEVFAWTDSTVVLAWLKRHANVWPTFIANRVGEIQRSMSAEQWQHVPGTENPADVASRGIMPSEIKDHPLWWTGPNWLKGDQHRWPVQHPILIDDSLLELKEVKCAIVQIQKMELYDLANRFSSWNKLIRITAYCCRFLSLNRSSELALSAKEVEAARMVWLRLVQRHEFGDISNGNVLKGRLNRLRPFVDDNGLLRVGGRLNNANLTYDEQHPIILTGKTAVTVLIIRDAHERVFHGGPQNTIAQLHQRYWFVNGRRLVRNIIHKCVTCTKAKPRKQEQLMGDLPSARVQPHRPFLHTGVDYAGPIWSRTSKGRGHKATKSWIAVFICFTTKAVHLELVSALTSEAFVAAFHRFTARRGNCSDVYCDNGTNFVGADRDMRKHLGEAMTDDTWRAILCSTGTTYHFAPPGSPHFNGLAEATVKMAKAAMRKVLGESTLTFEELATFLTQVEAAINSRPICVMPSDGVDFAALTPGHFLVGQPLTAIPEPNLLEQNIPMARRWTSTQQMVQHFWRRWSHEYLHQLQQRQKWAKPQRNIEVGDIVIIQDECLVTRWKMGRVVETHPGADGHVRVVSIKTASGIIKRSIVKLCILPTDE